MALLNTAREEPRVTRMCLPLHPDLLRLQDESATPWPPISHSPAALTHTVAYAGLALHPQHLCCRAITPSHLLPCTWELRSTANNRGRADSVKLSRQPWCSPAPPSGFSLPGRGDLEEAKPQVPIPVATMAHCRDAGIPQIAAAALFQITAAQQPQGRIKSLSPPPAAGTAHGVSGTLG